MAFVLSQIILLLPALFFKEQFQPIDQELLRKADFLLSSFSDVVNSLDLTLQLVVQKIGIYNLKDGEP